MLSKDRVAGAVATTAADLSSNLLPFIFERLVVTRRLEVLDFGPAIGDTVQFFSQFKCRMRFADVYEADFLLNPDEDVSHRDLVRQIRESFNLEDGTILDICLFWDLFNYLDGPAFEAFIEALDPYVNEDTRGFAIGIFNARTELPNYQYGIKQMDLLRQMPRRESQAAVYSHSQRDLNRYLGYFEVTKSRLLSDGRAEYVLFENREDSANRKSVYNF